MKSKNPRRPLRAGTIELDLKHRRVSVRGESVDLTPKEFGLLRLLVERRGEVVSRDFLLQRVWGRAKPLQRQCRTIDVYILRLRRKLGGKGIRILTVRTVGYRLDISSQWIKHGSQMFSSGCC